MNKRKLPKDKIFNFLDQYLGEQICKRISFLSGEHKNKSLKHTRGIISQSMANAVDLYTKQSLPYNKIAQQILPDCLDKLQKHYLSAIKGHGEIIWSTISQRLHDEGIQQSKDLEGDIRFIIETSLPINTYQLSVNITALCSEFARMLGRYGLRLTADDKDSIAGKLQRKASLMELERSNTVRTVCGDLFTRALLPGNTSVSTKALEGYASETTQSSEKGITRKWIKANLSGDGLPTERQWDSIFGHDRTNRLRETNLGTEGKFVIHDFTAVVIWLEQKRGCQRKDIVKAISCNSEKTDKLDFWLRLMPK